MCTNKVSFMGFLHGYRIYCSSKCANNDPITKRKIIKTCQDKWGVDNPMQAEEIQEKAKQTCQDKWGVDNPYQAKVIKEKINKTLNDRYNTDYVMQCNTFKNKSKHTCQDKWGVDNPFQSEKIKNKIKLTCLDRYGVEYISQNKQIKEKIFKSRFNFYSQDEFKKGNLKFVPNIGKNETKILDKIEEKQNIKIIRQYPIAGFIVDGYCKNTNTVYEIHEQYHLNKNQIKKDNKRRKEIMLELHCHFIIIPDF
jgi:hypothetical protein